MGVCGYMCFYNFSDTDRRTNMKLDIINLHSGVSVMIRMMASR